jgi:predicted TIM-barrel fold metal-dependent hydrolase
MDRRNFISATILATAAGAATAVAGDRILGVAAGSTTHPIPAMAAAAADEPVKAEHSRTAAMRAITMEEHYFSPAFVAGPGKNLKQSLNPYIVKTFELASDLGPNRIALMDQAGIDVQILSHGPGIEQVEAGEQLPLSRDTNDYLRDCVAKFPARFAGFTTMPTATPDQAAKELDRMVTRHGFKGAIINGHTRGRYLDDKFFWPMLEAAQSLNAPIYLHPTPPPKAITDVYYAGFAPGVSDMFSTAGWGWHIETAIHVVRMALGGVFDQFPKLQIVVGHMGEALPFMLPRMDNNLPPQMTKLKRPISTYLRENVWYTFSGFNYSQNFMNLMHQVGVDRIMFSADHPYASMAQARTFLDHLPISTADRERIAHGNAEHLFKM